MQFKGDYKHSHIINNTHFASVTVIAGTSEEADAYSTMISVLDPTGTKTLLNGKKGLKAVIIDKKLGITYHNMERR